MKKIQKTIVLGLSGGIACYKSAELCRLFIKAGFEVITIMTESATKFIQPLTFEALTQRKVITSLWERGIDDYIPHIELAKKTNLLVIAPATANIIAKFYSGIADDFLSTFFLSYNGPKLIAPAMNFEMYNYPATQRNIETLKKWKVKFIGPEYGELACKDKGRGRMAEPEKIFKEALKILK